VSGVGWLAQENGQNPEVIWTAFTPNTQGNIAYSNGYAEASPGNQPQAFGAAFLLNEG